VLLPLLFSRLEFSPAFWSLWGRKRGEEREK